MEKKMNTCGDINASLAGLQSAISGIGAATDAKIAPLLAKIQALEAAIARAGNNDFVKKGDVERLVNPLIGVAVGGFATKEMVQGLNLNFATKGELNTVSGKITTVETVATSAITKAEKAASTASNLSFEIRKVENVANDASTLARRISPEDVKKALAAAEASGQRVNVAIEIAQEAKGTANSASSAAGSAASKADDARKLAGRAAGTADEAAGGAARAGQIATKAAGKADDAARGLGKLAGQVAGQLAKFAPLLALLGIVSTLLEVALQAGTLVVLDQRLDEIDRGMNLLNQAVSDVYTALSRMRSYIDQRDKELYDWFSKRGNDLLAEMQRLFRSIKFPELEALKTQITNLSNSFTNFQAGLVPTIDGRIGSFLAGLGLGAIGSRLTNLENATKNMPQCRYTPGLDMQALAQSQANNKLSLGMQAFNTAQLKSVQSKLGSQLPGGLAGAASKIINGFNALTNLVNSSFSKTWKFLKLDRVLNILTFAASLHNAAMLSRSLADTLLDVTSSVLSAFGLRDANNSPFDLQEFFGSQIEDFIIRIVGQEAYEGNKAKWNAANRIISTATNLLWSMQSMIYNAIEGIEIVGGWVAKMANGIKFDGLVSDNMWGWFNPNPDFKSPIFKAMEKLDDLEDAASQIYMISTNVVDFQETAEQLGEQKAALQKSLTDYNDLATTQAIQEDFDNSSPEINPPDTAPAAEQE
jgi:hypothetical protein